MSEKDFNADIGQVMDQAEATLADVARVQGTFHAALLKAGFTKEQAFILVQDYLRIVWGSTMTGSTLE